VFRWLAASRRRLPGLLLSLRCRRKWRRRTTATRARARRLEWLPAAEREGGCGERVTGDGGERERWRPIEEREGAAREGEIEPNTIVAAPGKARVWRDRDKILSGRFELNSRG
jgi:hypothetical protein